MKRVIGLVCICLVASLSLIATAQEEPTTISAYSEVAGVHVNVNVLKVKQTPMRSQDFCTLLTGSYCSL